MTDLSDLIFSGHWAVLPPDLDPIETKEWLEALDAIVENEGPERATFILRKLLDHARAQRVPMPPVLNTPYAQHHPARGPAAVSRQSRYRAAHYRAGALERARDGGAREQASPRSWAATSRPTLRSRICSRSATTTSSAPDRAAIWSIFQPHSAPGVYARAYLRRPAHAKSSSPTIAAKSGGKGLSSYCHPWLMPAFWQFPTGSMGLGPLTAIYQARFMRYLENRGILDTAGAKCGASSATARWTSPNRSPACRSPRAKISTT